MTKSSIATILLVEGDIVVRHPLAEYLRECGFAVFEAVDGDEARQILTAPQIGVDIVLADMKTAASGFELRRWMQDRRHPADIILAGSIEKAVDQAAGVCRDGPALAKPYDHHLVLDRIRRSIARRNRGQVA